MAEEKNHSGSGPPENRQGEKGHLKIIFEIGCQKINLTIEWAGSIFGWIRRLLSRFIL
ncbi:MAG: hypothetical protein ABSB25_09320 [Sedimentisphaerales bacterium]|jgi:hypothetical protein